MFWRTQPDIILGSTAHPLPFPRMRLQGKDRSVHASVWGTTGAGKSKLLQSVFTQLASSEGGVGMIEPHHDLSYESLTWLLGNGFFRDRRAFERLVYLDFGNGGYVPFNVLKTRHDPHTTALNALEAMLRVWPELTVAPMFQTLFLSSMITLIANDLPITYLYPLLSDPAFRQACLARVHDPLVLQSFDHFDQLKRDQASLAGSTLRRAFLLLFSPVARYSFGQPDNWLDFRGLMDRGAIVILNLGNIQDHDTQRLIGAMLMVQIEQAALSRTDLPPHQRTPFTLLVDEWPSFAGQDDTIGTILSQARKYNLRLWLAAQSLAQISSRRLAGALENCRLNIAFGLGRDSAEVQARHVGTTDPMAIKDEAKYQQQHPQFFSVPEQWESWTRDLQTLEPRMAYVKLHHKPAVRIRTLTVKQPKVAPEKIAGVLAEYRRRYQRTRQEAEAAIRQLAVPGDNPFSLSNVQSGQPCQQRRYNNPVDLSAWEEKRGGR